MNRIEAIHSQIEYPWHLVIAVDGVSLNQLLHTAFPNDDFEGLIPTLLGSGMINEERALTFERILPDLGATAISPLLMCFNDGLGCSDVVAEVIAQSNLIRWNRLGWDMSEGVSSPGLTRRAQVENIGTFVEWLPDIGPYIFKRVEYELFVEAFRRELQREPPRWCLWATVYKGTAHLDFDPAEVGALHNSETGQYYFPEEIDPDGVLQRRFPFWARIAIRKEFEDRVAFGLRKTVVEIISANSITAKFLATDVRDEKLFTIAPSLIPQLCEELKVLQKNAEDRADQALMAFVGDTEALAEVAVREGNPIHRQPWCL